MRRHPDDHAVELTDSLANEGPLGYREEEGVLIDSTEGWDVRREPYLRTSLYEHYAEQNRWAERQPATITAGSKS